MKFNGVDPTTVHSAISISKEIPPGGPAREIATIDMAGGEIVANVTTIQDEYIVRVNTAARTYDEAMEAREKLAAWAMSSGKYEAELEPTHMPGKAYRAILKRIGRIENRFGTVDVVFMLPTPVLHSQKTNTVSGEQSVTLENKGTAPAVFEFEQTLSEAAEQLTYSMQYVPFLMLTGSFAAGEKISVNMEKGHVNVNGVQSDERIDFVESDLDKELLQGWQIVSSSAAGAMTVRWVEQWL